MVFVRSSGYISEYDQIPDRAPPSMLLLNVPEENGDVRVSLLQIVFVELK